MSQHLNFEPFVYPTAVPVSGDSANNTGQNQKVLSSLKQELTSIRQGMFKLIKIKSMEGTGLKRVSTNTENGRLNNMNTTDPNFSKANHSESKTILSSSTAKLAAKMTSLQQQNMVLRQKIADLQEQNNKIRQNQRNCILELQAHIKQLNAQIQTLIMQKKQSEHHHANHRKHRMPAEPYKQAHDKLNFVTVVQQKQQQCQATINKQPPIAQQLILNPQKQIITNLNNSHPHGHGHSSNKIHKMEQQQRRFHDKIGKLQQRIIGMQCIQRQYCRLIDRINEQQITGKLKRLNTKYQYY